MANDDTSIIKIGPVAAADSDSWDYKGCSKIIQIIIGHGEDYFGTAVGIKSIQFQYEQDGDILLSSRHGTTTGQKFDVVTLDYPMEWITAVYGSRLNDTTKGSNSTSTNKIFSLEFRTNKRCYGPFGYCSSNTCEKFTFHVGEYAQFYGFHGSSNINVLKTIGIYLKPITTLPTTSLDQNAVVPKKILKEDAGVIQIGPMQDNSDSSDAWDYKGCSKILQIFISHDKDGINSIQFQYEHNGALVMSRCNGASIGTQFDVLTLKQPMEYITSVSGYRRQYNISTLSFKTNMSTYGPFGCRFGIEQEITYDWGPNARFWGFYGSSYGCRLGSIGIYLKPIITLTTTSHGQNVVVPNREK